MKVGVIAVVGFAIGVAWPRLAGIRPGPSAPGEATAAASASGRAPEAPAGTAAATVASAAPSAGKETAAPEDTAVPLNNAPPAILVTHGAVVTCKSADGEVMKGAACGGLSAFDGLAQPRLKRLAHCPGAQGLSGKLSAVFALDFTRNKIGFSFGKTSTVGNRDSLDQCLRMSFLNVSLGPIPHDNASYAVFYSVTFTPRDSSAPVDAPVAATVTATPEPESSSQTAQVAWEVAIVRDTPRTGAVIARLARGTKVKVGTGQDGWYRVQYGNDFGSEGWVYRGAIGK